MTSDEYFVRFLHKRSDDCGLPFSFLRRCAIQFIGRIDDIVQPGGRICASRDVMDAHPAAPSESICPQFS
jgi:hypothetical protein